MAKTEKYRKTVGGYKILADRAICDENGRSLTIHLDDDGQIDSIGGKDIKEPEVDTHYSPNSSNAQSGLAVAEAIAGTGQVPSVTSSDNGKVLMAKWSSSTGSYSWDEAPSGVPEATAADNGKVLGVTDTAGHFGWVNQQDISGKADKATTLSGYGITDAYTKTETDSLLATKVDKDGSKVLSSNDFTDSYRDKLSGISAGAQVNVIESVSVAGTKLSISEKSVDIPAATGEIYGVVTGTERTRWNSWGSNEYDVPLFVDQRIMLLWYGTGWGEVLAPSRGIANPTIGYDADGPLDVSGTSWAGTPYISKSNLGGRVSGPWLDDNKGIHWTHESITSQISKNKPFTIEFWLKDDYPESTSGFHDGNYPVSLLGNTGFSISNNDIIPTLGIGGWFGYVSYQYPYYNSSTNTGLGSHSIGSVMPWYQKDAWVHVALTYDGTGNKAGLHLYANGLELLNNDKSLGALLENSNFNWIFSNPQSLSIMQNWPYYPDYSCNWKIAQLAMFNYCKYTGNFTPQTTPYCLGVD